jgi:hypothetical protein
MILGMQHEAARLFDRPAVAQADNPVDRAVLDAEALQQRFQRAGTEAAVNPSSRCRHGLPSE